MSLPDASSLLVMPARRAPRAIALALVDDADAARQRLVAGTDPEALHDFRVALRRLRSLLRAHETLVHDTVHAKLVRRLRDIARATGAGRDREVHLVLLDRLAIDLPLRQRALLGTFREALAVADDAQAAVDEALDEWTRLQPKLREALGEWIERRRVDDSNAHPLPYGSVAADAVEAAASALAKRLGRTHDAREEEDAHRARIAGKQLRYLLQPLSDGDDTKELLRTLRALQDALGAMHDAHTLITRVHEALDLAARAQVAAEAAALAQAAAAPADATDDAARRAAAQAAIRRARRSDARPALLALVRLLHAEVAREWAHVAPWVTEAGRKALRAQGAAVAARWRAHVAPPLEIERKYLLQALPPQVQAVTPMVLRQGYVPGRALVERVRCVESSGTRRWYRTVKLGRGVSRIEVEEETTAAIGEALWALTEGRRVTKRRYVVQDGEHAWEIDDFSDRDLVLAEVELSHADEDPAPPEWLARWIVRDVTDEDAYTNVVLAR